MKREPQRMTTEYGKGKAQAGDYWYWADIRNGIASMGVTKDALLDLHDRLVLLEGRGKEAADNRKNIRKT